jgi:cell division protein FtsB
MEAFSMVVAIVAISCTAGIINNYLKTKRLEQKQLEAEVEALKQRVAVLEEIVTDDRYRLNRELEKLERQA